MKLRKATQNDIGAVEKLYDAIHTAEENGNRHRPDGIQWH